MAETKVASASASQPEAQADSTQPAPAPVASPAVANASAPTAPAAKAKKRHVVTGAVAVLPMEGGSEKYLYRGALVADGFTEAGIKHALALGLIGQAK